MVKIKQGDIIHAPFLSEKLKVITTRAHLGDVELTYNEWIAARRLGDKYWLYIVANVRENPTLYVIQNPAENLKPVEHREIKYLIPIEEWKNKGEKVEF